MTVWIRAEPSFEEWVQILNIYAYYIGIYILIAASVIVLIVSFLGCCSALMEHTSALFLVRVQSSEFTPFAFYHSKHSPHFSIHKNEIGVICNGRKLMIE